MRAWKLEEARNRFSEAVRRAMAGEPQLVTRHGKEAVVIIGADEYRQLTAPGNLREFLVESPFGEAMGRGDLDLERPLDHGRDVPL